MIQTHALWVLVAAVHSLVALHVPDPYMDEVFHVPQTIKYCAGQFSSWDPKITTFPGTYVAALAALPYLC